MRAWFAASLLAAAAFDLTRSAAAQSSGGNFAITRSSLENAASSSGGNFALQSVVAQPVVGNIAAGSFAISGGIVVPPPTAPAGDAVFAHGFE